MDSWNQQFGTLRSMLQRGEARELGALLVHLRVMRDAAPARYDGVCLPYLRGATLPELWLGDTILPEELPLLPETAQVGMDWGWRATVEAEVLRRVTRLRITGVCAELCTLLASHRLASLDTLEVNSPNLSLYALEKLLASAGRGACTLRALHLRGVPLGVDGARVLTRAPSARTLHTLSVERGALGDVGLRVLASAPSIRALRTLRLAQCKLTGSGLLAMTRAPHLRTLRSLDLEGNPVTGEDVALLERASWPDLRALGLFDTYLGDAGQETFASSALLDGIESLDLEHTDLDDRALFALARSPHTSSLHTLNVANNRVTDRGLRALSAAHLPHLHTLNIAYNHFGAEGLHTLLDGDGLPALRTLNATSNTVGDPTLARLLDALSQDRALRVLTRWRR